MDAFGNYTANINSAAAYSSVTIGRLWKGSGSPASTLGTTGDLYVDEDTGTLYTKSAVGTWSS